MKIKVCGMRDPQNIKEIAALQPDYMGFIFYEKSPRFAGNLDPEIVKVLPATIQRVGVFVDAPEETILRTIARYSLDMVQLHGNETPETCRRIRSACPVIKAISVRTAEDVIQGAKTFDGQVNYLLFDTKTSLYGGSGEQFDWSALKNQTGKTPFFLSGGIGPEDAERIAELDFPILHGVDLNSRFELEPGIKKSDFLRSFLNAFRT